MEFASPFFEACNHGFLNIGTFFRIIVRYGPYQIPCTKGTGIEQVEVIEYRTKWSSTPSNFRKSVEDVLHVTTQLYRI